MSVVNAAPVEECNEVKKEKMTLSELEQQLADQLDGYEVELDYQIDDLRERYEIVDIEGNSIENKIDWDDFSAYGSFEVSYDGKLLSPAERAVDDFKSTINYFRRRVSQFWKDVQNKEEPIQRTGGYSSFGNSLLGIVSYDRVVKSNQKRATTKIDECEGLSPEERHSFVLRINDLAASVETFIESGEEK